MNSLSKSHNMAGWRVGMIVGQADVIQELLKVKTQMDSGMFRGIQEAAVKALQAGPEWYDALNAEYRRRQVVARRIMDTLGCSYDVNAGGLYVWGRIPEIPGQAGNGVTPGPDRVSPAQALSDRILYEAGVFLTPGFIFGKNGSNYLRISLCANVPTLERALEKVRKMQPIDK